MAKPADEQMAVAYLEGRWERVGRHLEFNFLAGNEERRARAALARILRDPGRVTPSILSLIASLIDPHAGADQPHQRFQTRQFKIVSRGKAANHGRDLGIARYVAEKRASGIKPNAVFGEASSEFGVHRSQVTLAWKKYRRMFEASLK